MRDTAQAATKTDTPGKWQRYVVAGLAGILTVAVIIALWFVFVFFLAFACSASGCDGGQFWAVFAIASAVACLIAFAVIQALWEWATGRWR